MKILVTGVAGFIGMHVTKTLLDQGHEVIGLDNLSGYYSIDLKKSRLEILGTYSNFEFKLIDLSKKYELDTELSKNHFDQVIHLAAQAGVRYSFENPQSYIDANLHGFFNIIDFCKQKKITSFLYASSSSVYGNREDVPFKENESALQPVSLYAATKISNEAMAYSYAYNHGITAIGLRFFTVYGPWGRPDMAPYKFLEKIHKGESLEIYSDGSLIRDYTYIDDIVEGIIRLNSWSLEQKNGTCEIFNIGSNKPYSVLEFVKALEESSNLIAKKEFIPFQPGDVQKTYACVEKLIETIGYAPKTSLRDGLDQLSEWYKNYNNL